MCCSSESETIVNSPTDLRASRALELLARLQQTAASFAQREEQLTREIANRRHTSNRKFRDAIEKADAQLTSRTEDADARRKSEEERLTALYEGRRARVQRTGHLFLDLGGGTRVERRRVEGDLG